MEKECRCCKKVYNFCVSCLLTRPYLRQFCSVKCAINFREKEGGFNNGESVPKDNNKIK